MGIHAIRQILVPTDFSPASEAALAVALRIARQVPWELVLLHVIDSRRWELADFLPLGAVERLEESAIRMSEESMARLTTDDGGRSLITEQIVRLGNPAREILEVAESSRADLIVMGTHGRMGVRRLLYGSVAERVVREAPCPVLTVKPDLAASRSRFRHPRDRRESGFRSLHLGPPT